MVFLVNLASQMVSKFLILYRYICAINPYSMKPTLLLQVAFHKSYRLDAWWHPYRYLGESAIALSPSNGGQIGQESPAP